MSVQTVDYLLIGHLACDRTPQGLRLGGTAAYSALTARALGMKVGIVTSFGNEIPLSELDGIPIQNAPTEHSTTFENIYTSNGRQQYLHHRASDLQASHVPPAWRSARIVHLGPIAGEGRSLLDEEFGASLLGVTPQGWMRAWDEQGQVHPKKWEDAERVLPRLGAVVISVEDVGYDEEQIEALASMARILVVTEGAAGARLYWNGDLRRFNAPKQREVDATGAGDIFAAAFFWRLYSTRDPWAAAAFATKLASFSVTRMGLDSIPTREEIQRCLVEVL
ncbi:MAG: PfkB family carbohydrate kinase [Anaerolineales bacterium]|nr:PfkB family carbohydrate kinase [Anaerolineales bacterium]